MEGNLPSTAQGRVQTTCLVVLATLAMGAALHWLRPVMIPFVLAVFIAISLAPLIDLQSEQLKIPRMVALFTTVLVTGFLLLLLGSLVSASVRELSGNVLLYSSQLEILAERAIAFLPDEAGRWINEGDVRELIESPVAMVGGVLVGTTNAILELLSRSLMVFHFVTFLLIGAPQHPHPSPTVFNLLLARRSLAGSAIGGIAETQEMLDVCAERGITSDIELIPIQKINEAYSRMLEGDVKYRFVIDMKSLGSQE